MDIFKAVPLFSFLILLILVIGRITFMKNKGIQVSSKSGGSKILEIVLYPFFILFLLLFVLELCRPVFPNSFDILPTLITNPLANQLVLNIIGSGLIVLSLIFLLLTLIHFRKSLRFGMNSNNLGQLITSGVFLLSRNPFFVSLKLYFWGIAIQIPSPFFIGFALLATVSIHFFILKEEKFMKENYGEEYKKYANRVRRYF